ncbi:acyl-CoA dehydrogenase family protein [Micromonospora sp. NPDC048868]|uniref:acyl-CoA dehydrogenase family protein n=1 Tax=unclassified Micromonospora TaxID=2617518 RepID=UPI00371B03E4
MRDMIDECEQTAYSAGLAAGLAVALAAAPGITPPGRVAAVPTAALPAGWATTPASTVGHRMAGQEGISFATTDDHPGLADGQLTQFCAHLGAVRLGVTRRLLEWAVEYLSGRTVGGEPTIRKQLVLGVLADVQTAVEAARRSLRVSGTVPAAVLDVHDRVTTLDWEAAKLLGASGYVAGTPTRGAYVAQLTANCWLPREGVS